MTGNLGNAGYHRKSSRLRATSFHKLLAAGQIRPYPSKKAAAESQLSQFSQQQPVADLANALEKSENISSTITPFSMQFNT
jgi:hypothetical protein